LTERLGKSKRLEEITMKKIIRMYEKIHKNQVRNGKSRLLDAIEEDYELDHYGSDNEKKKNLNDEVYKNALNSDNFATMATCQKRRRLRKIHKKKRLSVKMKDYWGSQYIKKKKSVTNERKTLRTEDQTTIKEDKTLKKSQRH